MSRTLADLLGHPSPENREHVRGARAGMRRTGGRSGPELSARTRRTASRVRRIFCSALAWVKLNFAHWEAVPGLDVDTAFRRYMTQALESADRREFDLATMRFVALLHNAHTSFWDEWLYHRSGRSLGVFAVPYGDRWMVATSVVEGIAPGDVITAVDGEPILRFYERLAPVISASNERSRRRALFYYGFLFPAVVRLTLADGQTVSIARETQHLPPPRPRATEAKRLAPDGAVGYIRIPSFDGAGFEDSAVAAVRRFARLPVIILDVRGNGGGNTPLRLLGALLDRRWSWWTEATPMMPALDRRDNAWGLYRWAPKPTEPDTAAYRGRVIVLADGECFSACEDFVMPLASTRRATVIGDTTGGSTGQPLGLDFGNGMTLRVGAKREYFPDGRPFEGVGIAPDLVVVTRPMDLRLDLRTHEDRVLVEAERRARENPVKSSGGG
jgi:carboxyl-terminal processing protease